MTHLATTIQGWAFYFNCLPSAKGGKLIAKQGAAKVCHIWRERICQRPAKELRMAVVLSIMCCSQTNVPAKKCAASKPVPPIMCCCQVTELECRLASSSSQLSSALEANSQSLERYREAKVEASQLVQQMEQVRSSLHVCSCLLGIFHRFCFNAVSTMVNAPYLCSKHLTLGKRT